MKLCLVCNFQFGDEQELCPKDMSKLVPLGKDPLIGKVIQDRYRVDSIIAKGSMGMVYRATQELIGREVAVKVLHGYLVADEESLKRFHKEAKAASRLNHPNITTLYDYGVLGTGQPYIVMDLLKGTNLSELLRQKGALPFEEAMPIMKQVCDALSEAHKRGVVHRDIKPENIVMEPSERGFSVKVVDFGIAKFVQEVDDTIGKITKTGTVCGSPTYMSPEQCDDNNVDHRTDIYSLGIVFYETVTGRVPFHANDIYMVMTMHVKDPPPPLKQVRPDLDFPPFLDQVIQKALAKHPDARYQAVDEFWEALQSIGRSSGIRPQAYAEPAAVASPADAPRSISEEEVQNVIARALQKRMQSTDYVEEADEEGAGATPLARMDPEVLKNKIAAATVVMQKQQHRQQIGEQRSNLRNKQRGAAWSLNMLGFLQSAFPAGLMLALCGALLWIVANESLIHKIVDPILGTQTKAPADGVDVDALIAQSKWDKARTILEKRKKDGVATADDIDALDSVYIRLAKQEAKAKKYKQAVAYLDKCSTECRNHEDVKILYKKYKSGK